MEKVRVLKDAFVDAPGRSTLLQNGRLETGEILIWNLKGKYCSTFAMTKCEPFKGERSNERDYRLSWKGAFVRQMMYSVNFYLLVLP